MKSIIFSICIITNIFAAEITAVNSTLIETSESNYQFKIPYKNSKINGKIKAYDGMGNNILVFNYKNNKALSAYINKDGKKEYLGKDIIKTINKDGFRVVSRTLKQIIQTN